MFGGTFDQNLPLTAGREEQPWGWVGPSPAGGIVPSLPVAGFQPGSPGRAQAGPAAGRSRWGCRPRPTVCWRGERDGREVCLHRACSGLSGPGLPGTPGCSPGGAGGGGVWSPLPPSSSRLWCGPYAPGGGWGGWTLPSPPHPVVPRRPSAPSWGPRLHLPGLSSPTRLLAQPPQDPPIATCPAKAPVLLPASRHTTPTSEPVATPLSRSTGSVLAAGVEAPGHDLAPGVPGSTRMVSKCLSVDGSATGPVAGRGTQ